MMTLPIWLLAMSDANMHDLIEWGGTVLLVALTYGYFRRRRD